MKDQGKKGFYLAARLLFYIYIILLSYFLFFSEHYGRSYITEDYRYNLELFKEIKRFIVYREKLGFESVMVNILGNILAFAPFGFLLPMLSRRYRSFFRVLFWSIIFTLTVEVLQLILRVGIFDVDDLFLNTLGSILGFLCHGVGSLIYTRNHRRKNKNSVN